jgi:hypothetical protein
LLCWMIMRLEHLWGTILLLIFFDLTRIHLLVFCVLSVTQRRMNSTSHMVDTAQISHTCLQRLR